jgi:rubrerythrin
LPFSQNPEAGFGAIAEGSNKNCKGGDEKMDIFEFAMEKEKFSEDYYRRLAEKTSNTGLKNICNMLAEEENKHYRVVELLSQKIQAKVAKTSVPDDAKKVFEKMRESAEKFNFNISELELYQKARDIEKQSRQFYIEKAEEVDDACQKGIFKKLANEEQKHFVLLENICDFIAKPQTYLENAEFYHIDDYAEGTF